eukprot:6137096-Alexandrium_andersonii.AAC.1
MPASGEREREPAELGEGMRAPLCLARCAALPLPLARSRRRRRTDARHRRYPHLLGGPLWQRGAPGRHLGQPSRPRRPRAPPGTFGRSPLRLRRGHPRPESQRRAERARDPRRPRPRRRARLRSRGRWPPRG